jgi:hypothetical protein
MGVLSWPVLGCENRGGGGLEHGAGVVVAPRLSRRGERVDLTADECRVAFSAWAASRTGGGIQLEDGADYPAAHALAERGWLRRGFVRGALSWFWTAQADQALAVADLTGPGRVSAN